MQTGVKMEIEEEISLIEWLVNNYKSFGKFELNYHVLSILITKIFQCKETDIIELVNFLILFIISEITL